MASQTNQAKKLTFGTKIQSSSFPRSARESSQQQSNYWRELPSELDSASLISYTSLKDLIPSSKGLTIQSVYEIPITNLLVKKAAWVYLQSMPAVLPPTPKEQILCLAWGDVQYPVKACFRFIRRNIINKIVNAFRKLFHWSKLQVGSN